jgi:ribose 1,5-bisphosphokinase PhnN
VGFAEVAMRLAVFHTKTGNGCGFSHTRFRFHLLVRGVVMMVMTVVMARRCEGRGREQQHQGEHEKLFHGYIVAIRKRSGCGRF